MITFKVNSSLKYKVLGLLCLVIGFSVLGYTFMLFLTQMLSFSTNLPVDATGRIQVPTSPMALVSSAVLVPGLIGVCLMILGGILYVVPYMILAKQVIQKVVAPGGTAIDEKFICGVLSGLLGVDITSEETA